jgi:hypothetical protein
VAVDQAGGVLGAHDRTIHLQRVERHDGAQHVDLLVAHRIGVVGHGRLHRREGDKLHRVVLHHVADRAGLVVVAAARAHAQALGHGDLHVIDIVAVPDRLEDAVAEAEDQDILHRLLAQVVVDAVDLLLAEDAQQVLVEFLRAGEIMAEGLLDDDARPAAVGRHGQTHLLEQRRDRHEDVGRRGQVEEMILKCTARLVQAVNPFGEGGEALPCIVGARLIKEPLGEGGRPRFVEGAAMLARIVFTQGGQRLAAEFLIAHRRARIAEHRKVRVEQALPVEVEECGEQLALGQVAGSAKDDEQIGRCGAFHARSRFRKLRGARSEGRCLPCSLRRPEFREGMIAWFAGCWNSPPYDKCNGCGSNGCSTIQPG